MNFMAGITQFRDEEPGPCLGTEHPEALSIPSQLSHVIWWKLFHGEGGTRLSS